MGTLEVTATTAWTGPAGGATAFLELAGRGAFLGLAGDDEEGTDCDFLGEGGAADEALGDCRDSAAAGR